MAHKLERKWKNFDDLVDPRTPNADWMELAMMRDYANENAHEREGYTIFEARRAGFSQLVSSHGNA